MRNIFTFLSYVVIFAAIFHYVVNQKELQHASHNNMTHEIIQVPEGKSIPAVSIRTKQDKTGAWLLEVTTDNFEFAPSKVGEKSLSYHEGHAHLYINGKKITRLYGRYYDLGTFKKGKYEIMVSLNTNNHRPLMHKGKNIADRAFIYVNNYDKRR